MKIVSSGHGLKVKGASSKFMDEVTEARRVVNRVNEICKEMGDPITIFHEDKATTPSTNLANIVAFHNSKSRTHDISIHFNSFDGTATGVEVWGYDNGTKTLGEAICKGLSSAMGIKNRGFKVNPKYYFVKNTNKPAIIVEVCFLDNEGDANAYKKNFEKVCIALAEAITGKTYKPTNTTPSTEGKTKYFRVIAGSYTVEANADKVVADLQKQGIKAFKEVFYK